MTLLMDALTRGGPSDVCWEWTNAKTPNGYGQAWWQGRVRLVHRVAYEWFVGPIPLGHDIDHLCRNRACYNPTHLEAVTRRENLNRSPIVMADKPSIYLAAAASSKARLARTHCKRGHPYTAKRQCAVCRRLRYPRYRKAAA